MRQLHRFQLRLLRRILLPLQLLGPFHYFSILLNLLDPQRFRHPPPLAFFQKPGYRKKPYLPLLPHPLSEASLTAVLPETDGQISVQAPPCKNLPPEVPSLRLQWYE